MKKSTSNAPSKYDSAMLMAMVIGAVDGAPFMTPPLFVALAEACASAYLRGSGGRVTQRRVNRLLLTITRHAALADTADGDRWSYWKAKSEEVQRERSSNHRTSSGRSLPQFMRKDFYELREDCGLGILGAGGQVALIGKGFRVRAFDDLGDARLFALELLDAICRAEADHGPELEVLDENTAAEAVDDWNEAIRWRETNFGEEGDDKH